MKIKIRKEFNELADIFRASPHMIADYFGVSPLHIETLLRIRGQMRRGESIKDAIIHNYGKVTYEKCESLLDVCPFYRDGETGGASHRSRNGEREASAQA